MQFTGLLHVPCKIGVTKIRHILWGHICDNRYNTMSTYRQSRIDSEVIARQQQEVLWTNAYHIAYLLQVACGLLNTYDVLYLCKPGDGLREHVHTSPSGDVVENYRDVHLFGDLPVVLIKPFLSGLVVVWCYQ